MSSVRGMIDAIVSGTKHLFQTRMTLRYPEQKLEFVGEGYKYEPKKGAGIPGFKGRHILYEDKCTGCQLCSIACDGVAIAIEMVKIPGDYKQNKKSIWPQIDYGKCVFCGLCVDACPFYAIFMTNDYELCAYDKKSLIYTPQQLFVEPKLEGLTYKVKFEGGAHHG